MHQISRTKNGENMCKEKRIFDILTNYTEKWPDQQVALARKENGTWRKYSPTEYLDLSRKVAGAAYEEE